MAQRFLLAFVFAILGVNVVALADLSMTVMSFNIRYGTANDGENSWELRKDLVVDMIRRYEPTVFGTQECLDFQADYLAEHMPEYRWFGVGREMDGTGERMAVFYRADRISPIESGNFWLSETPATPGTSSWDSACNRMATWAKFYDHDTKSFFYFVNTHLDHRSEPARQGGAKVVADFISRLPGDAPVILTGDFNSTAGSSEAYSILTQSGLADAWTTAKEQAGPPITWSAFEAPKPDTDRRIDWILVRGPIAVKRCETVTFNQDGRYPSDHFPVAAELVVTTTNN